MTINLILFFKYIIAGAIIFVIAMAPVWLARQTKKDKQKMVWVRFYCWLFGWTGIGWLIALIIAVRK